MTHYALLNATIQSFEAAEDMERALLAADSRRQQQRRSHKHANRPKEATRQAAEINGGSIMTDPRDYIDPDEGRDFPSPFYAIAEPCESCGEPTFRGRVWNPEHELWIATDCQCNTPEVPVCPNLAPLIAQANTVREVVRVCRRNQP